MIQPKLLVIDDQQSTLTLIKNVAEEIGYQVEATPDAGRFRSLVRSFRPDLILMDIIMPEEDGIELLRFLAAQKIGTSVIVMSGHGQRLLNTVEKMGIAWGLKLRAVQKPVGSGGWRDLLSLDPAQTPSSSGF
jgi:CheY-like chemotaxis protein